MKRRSNSAEASQTCGKAAGRPGRRRREKEGEREGVREGQPTNPAAGVETQDGVEKSLSTN